VTPATDSRASCSASCAACGRGSAGAPSAGSIPRSCGSGQARRRRRPATDRASRAGAGLGRTRDSSPSVLLAPLCQVQQHLMAVRQYTPGGEHRLARLPQMQPLGQGRRRTGRSPRTRTDCGWQTPRIPPTVAACIRVLDFEPIGRAAGAAGTAGCNRRITSSKENGNSSSRSSIEGRSNSRSRG